MVKLPVKHKEKIKTTKPVYNKTIVVTENEDLNQLLDNNNFLYQAEAPIPTKSVIQNLCKESVIGSSYYTSYEDPNNNQTNLDTNGSKIHPEMYEYENPQLQSQDNSLKLPNNQNTNLNTNKPKEKVYARVSKFPNPNTNNNYQSSKTSQAPQYPTTNINDNNIESNQNQPNTNNIINNEGHYVQQYFHEDNIPETTTYEGKSLKEDNVNLNNPELNISKKEENELYTISRNQFWYIV